jgi:hypothetical protein
VRVDDGDVAGPPERHVANQAFVQETRERIDVGATVDLIAADLLRGDVIDRSHDVPRIRNAPIRGARAESEVGEVAVLLPRTTGEEDVGGLHVPMHQPAFVRGVERARHLLDELECSRRYERAFGMQQRLQVGALDVAHRDVEQAVDLARLVDGDDVRVIEGGGELRLAQEAQAKALVLREAGRQELQRNLPLQPRIVGQIDDAHAPMAEHALDAVARKLGADPFLGYDGHRSRVRRRSRAH